MFPEACARVPRHRRVRASRPVSRARGGLTRRLVPGKAPRTALRTGRTRVVVRLALPGTGTSTCLLRRGYARACYCDHPDLHQHAGAKPSPVRTPAPRRLFISLYIWQSGSAFDGLSAPQPGTFPRADRTVHKRTTHWTTDWNTERNGHRCVSPTAVTRDYPQTAR